MNKKRKKINVKITREIITSLSRICLDYNGDMKYYDNEINNMFLNILLNNILKEINNTIVDLWLKYNNNNCRYTTFITLYYFIFSNFIDLLKGKELSDLKK